MPRLLIFILISFLEIINTRSQKFTARTFTIDYKNDCFLKDGQPFRYISGSMHYFRVPRPLWEDRFNKLRLAGLNAIQTYIYWARHEPEQGEYDFYDQNDIFTYFDMAAKHGFVIILRPGPYIDAEVDMGGFPYWLLKENPHIQLRTSDPTYLKYVDSWFNYILPKLQPYLYINGGPIITVQVENEYGSYWACDFSYTAHIHDLLQKHLGNVLLFTTDGGADYFLKCGKMKGVYATVDFGAGSNVTDGFAAQRKVEPHGPLVNSEFYPGWIDHYGQNHSTVPTDSVVNTLKQILDMNASVSIYLFAGGTDFGFQKGANELPAFGPAPVSYDFDAPISESGDLTEKYFAIRNLIGKYNPLPPDPVPPNPPKYSYGEVKMSYLCTLLDLLPSMLPFKSKDTLSFEAIGQAYGFVIYRTNIIQLFPDPAHLHIPALRDRAYVFVNQRFVGILDRSESIYEMGITIQPNQTLDIVVENQGRICYGSNTNDSKGILTNVTIGNKKIENWSMYSFPFNYSFNQHLQNMYLGKFATRRSNIVSGLNSEFEHSLDPMQFSGLPTLYFGEFEVPNKTGFPQDTFLRMDGWYKGIVLINDFNVGRYWPIQGPQVTLYIPKHLLKPAPDTNLILMLELEHAPEDNLVVKFTDTAVLNGTTPNPDVSDLQNLGGILKMVGKKISFWKKTRLTIET